MALAVAPTPKVYPRVLTTLDAAMNMLTTADFGELRDPVLAVPTV
jgi:hypothetical protein